MTHLRKMMLEELERRNYARLAANSCIGRAPHHVTNLPALF
jgi:hypothetical protein